MVMMYAWYWWWVEIYWIDRIFANSSSKVFRSLPSQNEGDQEDYNHNGDLHEKLINVSFDRAEEEEVLLRKFNDTQNPRHKLQAFVIQFTTVLSHLLAKSLPAFFAVYLLASLASLRIPSLTLPLSVLTLVLLALFTYYLSQQQQHLSDYRPLTKSLLLASLVLIVECQPQRLWVMLHAEMFLAWAVIVK
jgi:hypothetical protein